MVTWLLALIYVTQAIAVLWAAKRFAKECDVVLLIPSTAIIMGFVLQTGLPLAFHQLRQDGMLVRFSERSQETGLMLILLGAPCIVVGTVLGREIGKRLDVPRRLSEKVISEQRTWVVIAIMSAVTFLFKFQTGFVNTQAINPYRWEIWRWYLSFLDSGAIVVSGLLATALVGSIRVRPALVVAYIITATNVLVEISRKNTGPIVVTAVLLTVAYFKGGRRRSRALVVVCALAAITYVGLTYQRAKSWAVENESTIGEEIRISIEERQGFDNIALLFYVIDITPQPYEYFYGKTFLGLVPIPRSWWANRPPAHSAYVGMQLQGLDVRVFDIQKFNRSGRLSVSATVLGEGFANFGIKGALMLEVLVGAFVGLYEMMLRKHRNAPLMAASLGIIPFFLLTQERGDVSMMNVGWIQAVAVMTMLFLILGKRTETDWTQRS